MTDLFARLLAWIASWKWAGPEEDFHDTSGFGL